MKIIFKNDFIATTFFNRIRRSQGNKIPESKILERILKELYYVGMENREENITPGIYLLKDL